MVAKEWRDARWKFVIAVAGAVPALLIVAAYLPPYESSARVVGRLTDTMALGQILNVYGGGGVALALLAILLGVVTASEEVGRETIFLLLSRPTGRTRILLTKYAISAGVLLAAAVLGHALLIAAAAKGYPLSLLSVSGIVLSTVLMWVGALSPLGMAALFSIVFRSTLISLTVAFVTLCLVFYALPGYVALFVPYGIVEMVAPPLSWTSMTLYAGEGFASLNIIVCSATAALLLLAPLWFFRRRAY